MDCKIYKKIFKFLLILQLIYLYFFYELQKLEKMKYIRMHLFSNSLIYSQIFLNDEHQKM